MTAHQTQNSTTRTAERPATKAAGPLAAAALVLGLGLALTGCGTSATTAATSAPGTTTAASASPEASATAGDTASSTPTATPTETPSATATTAPPVQPALCTAASLTGSLDDSGGGTAGHIYLKLVVKNTSATTCILDGYPGVSLVNASVLTPIGAPAVRDPQAPSNGPISLASGQGATATLRYTQAGNYQDCIRVAADSVMVYPPSAYDRLVIAHPLTACSNADIELLSIGAFQP